VRLMPDNAEHSEAATIGDGRPDVAGLHPARDTNSRLKTLAGFRDSGVISLAEYEAQRAEILDEL
jgi:hypothetical protein